METKKLNSPSDSSTRNIQIIQMGIGYLSGPDGRVTLTAGGIRQGAPSLVPDPGVRNAPSAHYLPKSESGENMLRDCNCKK